MSSSPPTTKPRGTPSWVVLGIFVVLPVTLAFVLSRQAGAQLIRHRAIASSHGWTVEKKNEGQREWILHGFHRDVEFEAVHLLRQGGGTAWRLRMPLGREVSSWVLVMSPGVDWPAPTYGTISTLTTRTELPPLLPDAPGGLLVRAAPQAANEVLLPPVVNLLSAAKLPGEWTVSFVDDGIVMDGSGALPEGEALLPWLELSANLVRVFSPDAG
ncbi:MAG: hypothetical protein Q8S33_19375 [Myxococcales bacterium]|nr:hypothetical protein [Myxococcales bacterium]MDP3502507.1 hypothetical protein [Myxococcales bacterium]